MMTRDEIIKKMQEMPALPSQALKIIEIAQQSDFDIDQLEKVIQQDPVIASNLLRIANSARFGGTEKVTSIRASLVRLGQKNLYELMITHHVSNVINVPVQGYGLPAGVLLKHSAGVASGAERLVVQTGGNTAMAETAFTVGLLHDLGKIILGTYLKIDATHTLEIAQQEQIPFDEAERQVMGIDHAEAGALLLELWEIPETITIPVRWHHAPHKCPEEFQYLISIIHVADIISMIAGSGLGMDGLYYTLNPQSVQQLKLTQDIIERLILQTSEDWALWSDIITAEERGD